jgi:hypothetical protein
MDGMAGGIIASSEQEGGDGSEIGSIGRWGLDVERNTFFL